MGFKLLTLGLTCLSMGCWVGGAAVAKADDHSAPWPPLGTAGLILAGLGFLFILAGMFA